MIQGGAGSPKRTKVAGQHSPPPPRLCLPLGGTTGHSSWICLQQSRKRERPEAVCPVHLSAEQVPRKGTPNLTWIQLLTLVLLSQRLVRLLSLFPKQMRLMCPWHRVVMRKRWIKGGRSVRIEAVAQYKFYRIYTCLVCFKYLYSAHIFTCKHIYSITILHILPLFLAA